MSNLKLAFWNVNGLNFKALGCKFEIHEFSKEIEKFDFIFLLETWTDYQENFVPPTGYKYFHVHRPKRHKYGRKSGGIICLYKKYFDKKVMMVKSPISDILWIKIEKSVVGLDKDVFVGAVYISSKGSSGNYSSDLFEHLEVSVMRFLSVGYVILGGDFNARVGNLNDVIKDDSLNNFVPLPQFYNPDTVLVNRNFKDNIINSFGKSLTNLCISAKLRILNGRTVGDVLGNYTSYNSNGMSTVDYILADERVLPIFKYFHISPLMYLSDHCILSCSIHSSPLNQSSKNIRKHDSFIKPLPKSFKINHKNRDQFQHSMNLDVIKNKINTFINTEYNKADTDIAVTDFNDILVTAANLTVKTTPFVISNKQKKNRNTNKNKNHKKWYNTDCKKMKNSLVSAIKQMNKFPKDPNIRKQYNDTKRQYKKLLIETEKQFKKKIYTSLTTFEKDNPKGFWEAVQNLKNNTSSKRVQSDSVDPESWFNYFKHLHGNSDLPNTSPTPTPTQCNNIINTPISLEEITNRVKKLKSNKASASDLISNEMIKFSQNTIIPSLQKLFNLVFKFENFPSVWASSTITPIFKSGDPNNPPNYLTTAMVMILFMKIKLDLNLDLGQQITSLL